MGLLTRLRERLFRRRGPAHDDRSPGSERRVDYRDAMAAGGSDSGNIPPGYVKSYDEGRPKH